VIEKVCIMLEHLAENNGVILRLFTDPAIPEITLGDASRLRQIVLNLTNNAIKFSSKSDRSGRVYVKAMMTDSSMLEICVVDNGIGIEESNLAGLFTAFDQADVTTTRRFGGTGLGLSIARNLVQMMDGEITVQSTFNEGSIFRVCLPLVRPSGAGLKHSEIESQTKRNTSLLTGISCLVIGDAKEQVDDVTAYLTAAGAVVERVANLAIAQKQVVKPISGRWVWLLVTGNNPPSSDELRVIAAAKPERAIRFVIIRPGKRRKPRWQDVDLTVSVDGNVLLQKTMLKAVAIAAGLAQPQEQKFHEGQNDDAFVAPLRMHAIAQGKLILVAEDNNINQKVISQQLALLGFAADITNNGLEALARWHSGDYALLLTDVHMPEMDGYELTVAIRAQENDRSHIPIIALTANALKGQMQHCRDAGMDDYLCKPTPMEILGAMLKKWLPVAESKPVDISVLEALVGNDLEIISDFLQDFNHNATEVAAELIAACHSGQAEQVSVAAHKLKSSSRAVGALVLGELCEEIEHAAENSGLDLTELVLRFETEMVAVREYLNKL
jgi:two-component system sensor histidine kinase/response regulator